MAVCGRVKMVEDVIASKNEETPAAALQGSLRFWCLAMTYSHMGKPHTTIGDASFHC